MKPDPKSLRYGILILTGALILRMLTISTGADSAISFLFSPKVASILLYMETGRVIRPIDPEDVTEPVLDTPPEEVTKPAVSQKPDLSPSLPVFSENEANLVQINSACAYTVDVSALLQQPLIWNLTQEEPTVLIVHTHASESYTKTENYTESTDYRTLNTDYNMVSIGDRLAQLLETQGISVIHDRTIHDYPSYTDSYDHSRSAAQAYLEQYPSIQLVLDLHRDAVVDGKGNQLGYTVDTDDGEAAQLMFVVGTDAGGLNHPQWEKNMALAVKLHAQLERICPDICRPISFRKQRFNQDLSNGALLIEVGAAGNTRQEALLATEILAEAIIDLARGTVTADSTS